MPPSLPVAPHEEVTRDGLNLLLDGDLAREYQAAISSVVYSQDLRGTQQMNNVVGRNGDPFAKLSPPWLFPTLLIIGQIG